MKSKNSIGKMINFKMWKAKVKEVLLTEGLAKALGGKPESIKEDEWRKYPRKHVLQSGCTCRKRLLKFSEAERRRGRFGKNSRSFTV